MLSTLERVLVLKSVGIFADTPEETLIAIAGLLAEAEYGAGAQIFAQGDAGSSMFVIVSGRVRVFDQARTLNELGPRAVFGELALLDPEPRVASVEAIEETLLLRVDHQPFLALMADRPEISLEIIRVLTGYLRERVADLGQIDTQLRSLRGAS